MSIRLLVNTSHHTDAAIALNDDLRIESGWNMSEATLKNLYISLENAGFSATKYWEGLGNKFAVNRSIVEIRNSEGRVIVQANISVRELFNRIQDAQLHHKPYVDLMAETEPKALYIQAAQIAKR